MNDHSRMPVTDVVRGSFGFVLPEVGDTLGMVDASLKDVVDEISDILSRIGANDETVFDEAVSQLDERILVAVKQFFQRLDENGATLRIVQGACDFLLDRYAVALARSRVKELQISESAIELAGTVFMLPDFLHFDLRISENGQPTVIKGNVENAVLKQLNGQLESGADPIDVTTISVRPWTVELKKREINERNRPTRYVYTLSRLKRIAT